jgi:hypothetical protein
MRRLVTVAGAAVALVGLIAVAVPELVLGLPVDRALVGILGGVLLLGAASGIQRRRNLTLEYAETADPEVAAEMPAPGDEFDDRLDKAVGMRNTRDLRIQIRQSLHGAAVETIRRRTGRDEAEAERALEEGTWTDDPFAVGFFTTQPVRLPGRTRLETFFDPTPRYRRRIDHVTDALYELVTGEEADDDG